MCYDCDSSAARRELYMRQGAVDVDDFYKETNYAPKRKNNKPRQKKAGCPETGGSHVWVWTSEFDMDTLFYRHFGWPKHERRVCCGCLKYDRRRLTERYQRVRERKWAKKPRNTRRGEPIPRFSRRYYKCFEWYEWESEDPEYVAKRNALDEAARRHEFTPGRWFYDEW